MSEITFTKSEVIKALELVILGTTCRISAEEADEKLEGMSDELKVIVVTKLTEGLINLMCLRQARKQSNPFAEFLSQLKDSEECTRSKCTCKDNEGYACSECACKKEEPEITILKNGKPASDDEKEELFNIFKKMMGRD